jgi:hypothetical protein
MLIPAFASFYRYEYIASWTSSSSRRSGQRPSSATSPIVVPIHQFLTGLQTGAQLVAAGLDMDQPVERGGEVEVPEREHLVGELVTGEWENPVCDQQPSCDGGERRARLLMRRFEITALEHEPGKAEPANGLDELALGRWREAVLIDMAARRPKDPRGGVGS